MPPRIFVIKVRYTGRTHMAADKNPGTLDAEAPGPHEQGDDLQVGEQIPQLISQTLSSWVSVLLNPLGFFSEMRRTGGYLEP